MRRRAVQGWVEEQAKAAMSREAVDMTMEEKRGNEIQEAACKKAPPTYPAEGNVDIDSWFKPIRVSIGLLAASTGEGVPLNLN